MIVNKDGTLTLILSVNTTRKCLLGKSEWNKIQNSVALFLTLKRSREFAIVNMITLKQL